MAVRLTAILFALNREARPFLRRLRGAPRVRAAPCDAWQKDNLLVLVTGMGAKATERALDWLLEQEVRLVISAGFCGSLVPDIVIGEVFQSDAMTLASVDRPVITVEERMALHQKTGARIVDMESAVIVRRCQSAGVSCKSLRVVSDDFEHPLPTDLYPALDGERVRFRFLLWALCRRPRLLGDLFRLARDTRRASVVLAETLERLLTTTHSPKARG